MEIRRYDTVGVTMKRIGVIQDGSSLFHSLSYALSTGYRECKFIRSTYARGLRDDIIKELESRVDKLDPNSPTVYDSLGYKGLSEDDMIKELKSSLEVDLGVYIELLSRSLNVNILYYDEEQLVRLESVVDQPRSVSILRLRNGNYELLASSNGLVVVNRVG